MKSLLGVVVLLLSSGCAFMPHTDPYRPVNISTHRPPQERSARFHPQAATDIPEGPLTLSLAIDIALGNNPEIAAKGWDAAAAAARWEQADGERLPRLNIVGSYGHSLDRARLIAATMDGEPGLFTRDVVAGDIVLSMPLFTGGQLVNQVKAAELLHQTASHQLSRTREEIVFNVSSVFFNILAQKQVIQSLSFSRQTLSEHLARIDALINAQKAAKVDRMRTEVRIADIDQQLVREKNLLAIQHRALINLLGWNMHATKIIISGELGPETTAAVPDLESALVTAWRERSDYQAARSVVEAKAYFVDVANAGHWPKVSLQGAYGGRWAAGSTVGAGDEQGDTGRLGLVMEIPLYEGGRIDARVREQNAGLAAAQERLRAVVSQVRLDVETALLSIESSRKRAAAIEKSIAQATESLRIEQKKYDLGKGAIVDVLDAQNALLDTETTYYRMLADFHTALAQLKLAMGEE